MAVESESDLMGFFVPGEFGTEALVVTADGVEIPVVGIIDTIADSERPGANSRSSASPFITGAADAAIQRLQFVTPFLPLAAVRAEDGLIIDSGPYAGHYRIKEAPQRDGEICRLVLNKR